MKNNYSMRIKSAITLTIAFSFILSGVYFAWLSPLNEYPNYLEIARISSTIRPGQTASLTFDSDAGKKVAYSFDGYYYDTGHGIPSLPPTFSSVIYNPSGELIHTYESLTNYLPQQTITIRDSGTYKIEITNSNSNNGTAQINAYVQEMKPPTRPLEPVGHWFIFMALPVVGLGIWFAIVKIEIKPEDVKI